MFNNYSGILGYLTFPQKITLSIEETSEMEIIFFSKVTYRRANAVNTNILTVDFWVMARRIFL